MSAFKCYCDILIEEENPLFRPFTHLTHIPSNLLKSFYFLNNLLHKININIYSLKVEEKETSPLKRC